MNGPIHVDGTTAHLATFRELEETPVQTIIGRFVFILAMGGCAIHADDGMMFDLRISDGEGCSISEFRFVHKNPIAGGEIIVLNGVANEQYRDVLYLWTSMSREATFSIRVKISSGEVVSREFDEGSIKKGGIDLIMDRADHKCVLKPKTAD